MITFLAEQASETPGEQIAAVLVVLFIGILSIMIALA